MNSFNQYLINKIDVMEGIDFKSNKQRQLKKDKTRKIEKQQNKIHNRMMIITIITMLVLSITLLMATANETKTRQDECLKYHSERYCLKNN